VNLLLDTHILLWWLEDSPRLPAAAAGPIAAPDNQISVSAASAWEIAIKQATGKLQTAADIPRAIRDSDLLELPISIDHGFAAGALPRHHHDPFDRMLVAQAQIEGLTLVTVDPVFGLYDVRVLAL
jgi:PIN domain nuclease of toxin-antitoxin system